MGYVGAIRDTVPMNATHTQEELALYITTERRQAQPLVFWCQDQSPQKVYIQAQDSQYWVCFFRDQYRMIKKAGFCRAPDPHSFQLIST